MNISASWRSIFISDSGFHSSESITDEGNTKSTFAVVKVVLKVKKVRDRKSQATDGTAVVRKPRN